MALLLQFLGDNLRGSLSIQEAVADDQPDDLLGAAVISLGAARFQSQTQSPILFEGRQQLVITLAAEVELFSGVRGALAFALADDEHSQAAADLVVMADGQDASGPGEAELFL